MLRLVRLGVGRLLHLGLELACSRFAASSSATFVSCTTTACRAVALGERARLLRGRLRLRRLGDRLAPAGSADVAARGGLERLGLLLALGRLAVGLGLGDARLLLDARRLAASTRFSM